MIKFIQSSTLLVIFPPLKLATLRNKRKIPAINKENHEEQHTISQARDTNVPRIQEDYVTQVSEEIEGRVMKKLSGSLAERRITFWALSPNLTNFFWIHKFGFTPDPFWRHTETSVEKTRIRMRIVPRMIPMLKQRCLWANLHNVAARTMPTTRIRHFSQIFYMKWWKWTMSRLFKTLTVFFTSLPEA